MVPVSLVYAPNGFQGRIEWFVGSAVAGHVLTGVLLLAARLTVLRPRGSNPTRALLTALAWFVAIGCRGLFVGSVLTWRGLVDQPDFVYRFVSGGSVGTAVALCVTCLIASSREHRAALADLAVATQAADEAAARATSAARDVHQEVQSKVVAALDGLRDFIKAHSSADSARAALEVVDDVVRPLSHDFYSNTSARQATPAPRAKLPLRMWFSVMARAVPLAAPFSFATPLLDFLITAPTKIFTANTAIDLFMSLCAPLAMAGALAAGEQIRRLHQPSTIFTQWLFMAGIWISGGLAQAIFISSGGTSGQELRNVFVVQTFILVTLATTIALFAGAVRARMLVREQQEAALAMAIWHSERAQQVESVERRRLGRLIHGDVQARLSSLAARSDSLSQEQMVEIVDAITHDLKHALSQPSTIEQSLNVLQQLADSWKPLMDVTVTISGDVFAPDVVVELVREALTNAFRHGGASVVAVQVTGSEDGSHIFVRDNGELKKSAPGMGFQLFDELAEWSIDRESNDTVLSFTLKSPHSVRTL